MVIKVILILLIVAVIIFFIVKNIITKEEQPEVQSIAFENRFKVVEIIAGDTFIVSPGWKWNNEIGARIRPDGYNTPEKGDPKFQETKEKLEQLLLNKEIELKKPVMLSYGRLLCDVYLNDKNLKTYFPEYLVKEENPGERNV